MLAWLLRADREIFYLINGQLTSNSWDPLMRLLSNPVLAVFIMLVVLVVIIKQKNWSLLKIFIAVLLLVIFADFIAYNVFKPWFDRPRPCKGLGYVRLVAAEGCGGWQGFPSNHATNAMVVAMVTMFFAKWWLGVLAFFIVIWIGFSRIYLGVHYPLDVCAGFLWGGGISLAFSVIFRRRRLFSISSSSARQKKNQA